MTDDAIGRAIQMLEDLDGTASWAFFAGDDTGLDATLGHGSHEPAAVHLHLLATHMDALSQQLDTSVEKVAKAGVEAHEKMEAEGAAAVARDADYGGDYS